MRLSHRAGAYEIESLPSQPQVAHCHGFFVYPEMRGKGKAHVLKRDQISVLRYLGYDYAICTVCSNNAAQKTVLARAGWTKLSVSPPVAAALVAANLGEMRIRRTG